MKRHLQFLFASLIFCTGCSSTLSLRGTDDGQSAVLEALAKQQNAMEQSAQVLNSVIENQSALSEELRVARKQLEHLESQFTELKKQSEASPKALSLVESIPIAVVSETVVPSSETLDKIILGRIEWVWLDIVGRSLKAKMDTGAKSSSLSATNIQEFERDGKKWVRFSIPEFESDGMFEAPLIKYQNVRQASLEGMEVRAKIMLKLRIGGLVEETEFTLTDRSKMIYPVLLGRRFLRDIAIVDVSQKFIQTKYEETLELADKSTRTGLEDDEDEDERY